MLEYRFAAPQAMGWDPAGMLNLMANSEQWQLDLIDGFRIYIGPVYRSDVVHFRP